MQPNPWHELPRSPPYVLACDRLAVDVFNRDRSTDDKTRLHTNTMPEPFLGPWDAPVVVLLLNPGVSKNGEYDADLPDYVRSANGESAHFYLERSNSWWTRLVRQPRSERPQLDLSKLMLSVEFFPYRSVSFGCGHLRLPSQEFSFDLVRRAIRRKATIIVARGEQHWIGAIPELATDCELLRLSNPRAAALSSRNLGSNHYDRILRALEVGAG